MRKVLFNRSVTYLRDPVGFFVFSVRYVLRKLIIEGHYNRSSVKLPSYVTGTPVKPLYLIFRNFTSIGHLVVKALVLK